MAVRLIDIDYRNSLDDGTFVAVDASARINFYLAGATTPAEVWSDHELTSSLGSYVTIDSEGYPEYKNIWGADDVSYKIGIIRVGYNDSAERFFDYASVATATSATGDSTPAFTNSIANGDFTQWGRGTSFSNISGSAAAVEIADGFFVSQNNSAANEISRQAADSDGARYALRFGRPAASSSTEQIRVFFTLPTDEALRYRGKTGTFSIGIKKGANFSGTALGILGVIGTGVGESGNSINSGAWTGQTSFISASQAINTDIARFQFSGTIGENISEIGFQLAYTPTGTAGANDWAQVEDIQFQDAAAAGDFEALPVNVTKLLTRGLPKLGGQLFGLTLSNNGSDATNDIDIAAGYAADSADIRAIELTSALTKRLDAAWAVGTGNGGLDTGSIANGTYHVWLIMRSDTGVVDVLFSTSASSPTMPTNYDYKRRIGSIIRSGGAILAFVQIEDNFCLSSTVTDRSSTASLSYGLYTFTVPLGIVVFPFITQQQVQNTAGVVRTAIGGAVGATSNLTATRLAGEEDIASTNGAFATNTSAQLNMSVTITSGTLTSNGTFTYGWKDTRGRFG